MSTGVIVPAFTSLSILLQKRQSQTESIIPLEFALLLCCFHRSSLGHRSFIENYIAGEGKPLSNELFGQLFALMYWKESFPYLLAMSDKRSSNVTLSPFFKTAHCRSRNDFCPPTRRFQRGMHGESLLGTAPQKLLNRRAIAHLRRPTPCCEENNTDCAAPPHARLETYSTIS